MKLHSESTSVGFCFIVSLLIIIKLIIRQVNNIILKRKYSEQCKYNIRQKDTFCLLFFMKAYNEHKKTERIKNESKRGYS